MISSNPNKKSRNIPKNPDSQQKNENYFSEKDRNAVINENVNHRIKNTHDTKPTTKL